MLGWVEGIGTLLMGLGSVGLSVKSFAIHRQVKQLNAKLNDQ